MSNSDKPVTKAELDSAVSELRTEMHEQGSQLRTEMLEQASQLRTEMQEQGSDIRAEMAGMEMRLREELNHGTSEVIKQFKFVAEQIRSDIAGINADEISLVNDKLANHDQRISHLEKLN